MSKRRVSSVFVHLTWATWDRLPVLDQAVHAWLWPAIAQQARRLGCSEVWVGGYVDHAHVLVALPPTLSVADLVKRLKGASSRLASSKGLGFDFRWQSGYAAFSVSLGHVSTVAEYIAKQAWLHSDGTIDPNMELPPLDGT